MIGIKTIIIGVQWLQIGRWYIPTSINRERCPILLLESILICLTTQLRVSDLGIRGSLVPSQCYYSRSLSYFAGGVWSSLCLDEEFNWRSFTSSITFFLRELINHILLTSTYFKINMNRQIRTYWIDFLEF